MNLKINSSSLVGHRFLVILMGLLALTVSCLPLTRSSDDLLFGLFTHFLPAVNPASHTMIVSLDDLVPESGEPLSHARLSELIARLKKSKVAAAGLLLPLLPQQTSVDVNRFQVLIDNARPVVRSRLEKALNLVKGDEKLARVIRESGNVVLPIGNFPSDDMLRWIPESFQALHASRQQQGEIPGWIRSLSAPPVETMGSRRFQDNIFMTSAQGLGIVDDSDAPIRSLLLPFYDGLYPSFLLQLSALRASAHDGVLSVIDGKGIELGELFIKTGPGYRLFPQPVMLPESDELIVKAGDILNSRVHTSRFRNKRVLLGFISEERPLAAGLINSVGLDTMTSMARSINALLSGNYYSQPDWLYGLQRGMIVLIVVYLLLLPAKLRGLMGSGISVMLALLILNVSLVVLITRDIWLPLTVPVWLLLGAALVLPLRHRIAAAVMLLRHESARAYRDLAQNYQSQGQLDVALDCLLKCPVDAVTAEPLYSLGMDYERRRQFSKALSIYERIGQAMPGYRDIQERSGKLSSMPEYFSSTTVAPANPGAATIIIDDAMIARPVIGRYQIERELGRGAMGMVYLGNDPRISRTVAIKTMALAEEFDGGHLEEVKRRFYQEAETAGQLSHPNIVTIYDVGEEHDLAYIAMDYVEGHSLDFHATPETLLSLEEVFDIGIHIADALDYAHERKVVHRDVKPANIMYCNDSHILKIMDFGIACLTDNSKTRTGTVLGSPFYMSPEQIAGRRVDGRSDLFSLAITLYQLFTGELPFSGDSMAALMYQIANEKAASIRKVRGDLPVCLVRIINRAMEKDAEKRFQSGRLFADALFNCAERQGLTSSMKARR